MSKLVAIDYSGIEAVLTGWFMRDPAYIRLARLGVHAYLCSHLVGRPASASWEDTRLGAHLKEIKREYDCEPDNKYDKAKRCVHGCLTGDHEVLTLQGWTRLDALRDDQALLVWEPPLDPDDPVEGRLWWEIPQRVTRDPHVGDVIAFSGVGLSAVATPEHRFGVKSSSRAPWQIRTAEELLTRPGTWRTPVCGALRGHLPWGPLYALSVAIQADGTTRDRGTGERWRFHLHKARKRERLRQLAAAASSPLRAQPCSCPDARGEFLDILCPAPLLTANKHFDLAKLLTLERPAREAFLNEVLLWDGHIEEAVNHKRQEFLSTSYEDAQAVQTIAHVTGRQGTLRPKAKHKSFGQKPLWVVGLNRRRTAWFANLAKAERRPFNGMIYCVSVSTEHFIVRHRDRIWVSANTNYRLTPYGMHDRFPETYHTRKDAEAVQALYFELCPFLPRWQSATIDFTAKHNYWGGVGEPGVVGVHPYGNVHWFYDVIRYKPVTAPEALRLQHQNRPVVQVGSGRWFALTEGEDAKRCVANPPQSTATCIIKEAGLRLFAPPELSGCSGENYIADCGLGGRNPLRALVHDEFLMEVPDRLVDRVVERTVKEMCRPIAALPCPPEWGIGSHLRIGVEVMVGKNWDKKGGMEKITIEGIDVPMSPWSAAGELDELETLVEGVGGDEEEEREWSEEMLVALRG